MVQMVLMAPQGFHPVHGAYTKSLEIQAQHCHAYSERETKAWACAFLQKCEEYANKDGLSLDDWEEQPLDEAADMVVEHMMALADDQAKEERILPEDKNSFKLRLDSIFSDDDAAERVSKRCAWALQSFIVEEGYGHVLMPIALEDKDSVQVPVDFVNPTGPFARIIQSYQNLCKGQSSPEVKKNLAIEMVKSYVRHARKYRGLQDAMNNNNEASHCWTWVKMTFKRAVSKALAAIDPPPSIQGDRQDFLQESFKRELCSKCKNVTLWRKTKNNGVEVLFPSCPICTCASFSIKQQIQANGRGKIATLQTLGSDLGRLGSKFPTAKINVARAQSEVKMHQQMLELSDSADFSFLNTAMKEVVEAIEPVIDNDDNEQGSSSAATEDPVRPSKILASIRSCMEALIEDINKDQDSDRTTTLKRALAAAVVEATTVFQQYFFQQDSRISGIAKHYRDYIPLVRASVQSLEIPVTNDVVGKLLEVVSYACELGETKVGHHSQGFIAAEITIRNAASEMHRVRSPSIFRTLCIRVKGVLDKNPPPEQCGSIVAATLDGMQRWPSHPLVQATGVSLMYKIVRPAKHFEIIKAYNGLGIIGVAMQTCCSHTQTQLEACKLVSRVISHLVISSYFKENLDPVDRGLSALIKPVVSCMKAHSGHGLIAESVSTVVCQLVCAELGRCKKLFLIEDGLVALLKSMKILMRKQELQSRICMSLWHLSSRDEVRQVKFTKDILAPIVKCMDLYEKDKTIHFRALNFLGNITSQAPISRAALVNCGGGQVIQNSLKRFVTTSKIHCEGLRVMKNLLEDREVYPPASVEVRTLRSILIGMKDHVEKEKVQERSVVLLRSLQTWKCELHDQEYVSACYNALCRALANYEDNDVIVGTGLRLLVEFLPVMTQLDSAHDVDTKEVTRVEKVMKLHADSVDVQIGGCKLMQVFLKRDNLRDAIMEIDVISLVSVAMARHKDVISLQVAALTLLYSVAKIHPNNLARIRDICGRNLLMSLWRHQSQDSVCKPGCMLLSGLVVSPEKDFVIGACNLVAAIGKRHSQHLEIARLVCGLLLQVAQIRPDVVINANSELAFVVAMEKFPEDLQLQQDGCHLVLCLSQRCAHIMTETMIRMSLPVITAAAINFSLRRQLFHSALEVSNQFLKRKETYLPEHDVLVLVAAIKRALTLFREDSQVVATAFALISTLVVTARPIPSAERTEILCSLCYCMTSESVCESTRGTEIQRVGCVVLKKVSFLSQLRSWPIAMSRSCRQAINVAMETNRKDKDIQSAGCTVLSYLVSASGILADTKGIMNVLLAMKAKEFETDVTIQQGACRYIACSVHDEQYRNRVVGLDGTRLIMRALITFPKDSTIQHSVFQALYYLGGDTREVSILSEFLVSRDFPLDRVLGAALKALISLARASNENREVMRGMKLKEYLKAITDKHNGITKDRDTLLQILEQKPLHVYVNNTADNVSGLSADDSQKGSSRTLVSHDADKEINERLKQSYEKFYEKADDGRNNNNNNDIWNHVEKETFSDQRTVGTTATAGLSQSWHSQGSYLSATSTGTPKSLPVSTDDQFKSTKKNTRNPRRRGMTRF